MEFNTSCPDIVWDARVGDMDAVLEDVARGEQFTDVDNLGNTALHMASANGHVEITKYIIQQSPTEIINVANSEGNTALHWAAMNGHLVVVKALLDSGANHGIKNVIGKSALFVAQQYGHEAVSDLLLQQVSDVDVDNGLKDAGIIIPDDYTEELDETSTE